MALMILDEQVRSMKKLGEVLTPYNYPKTPPSDENDLTPLKIREVQVDGYSLIIHYNRSDYDEYYLETIQVMGRNTMWLPFYLVCKVAKRFLGERCLSLIELFQYNRKIYCWALMTNKDGQPLQRPDCTESDVYEGLEYSRMNAQQMNYH